MDDARIGELLLRRFGLRVHPEMGRYVLKRLGGETDGMIPIIGGDARTGVAVRQLVPVSELISAMNSTPPAST